MFYLKVAELYWLRKVNKRHLPEPDSPYISYNFLGTNPPLKKSVSISSPVVNLCSLLTANWKHVVNINPLVPSAP